MSSMMISVEEFNRLIQENNQLKEKVFQLEKKSNPVYKSFNDSRIDFCDYVISNGTVKNIDLNDNVISLLYGPPQTGKRNEILSYAFNSIKLNRVCFIVTDNFNTHKNLLMSEIKNCVIRYNATLSKSSRKIEFDDIVCSFDKFQDIIKDIERSAYAKINVFILHKNHMGTIYEIIEKLPYKKFSICFDEADQGTIKDINKTVVAGRTAIIHDILSFNNTNILFVTATPAAIMAAEQKIVNIKTENCHTLEVRSDYEVIGYTNGIKIKRFEDILDKYKKGRLSNTDISKIVDKSDSHEWKGGVVTGVLISCDRITEQNDIANFLKNKYHNSYILCVNNSETIISYPKNCNKTSISKIKDSLNVVLFEQVQKHWMENFQNTHEMYVFVIGGKMIGRSVAVRAEPVEKPTSCYDMLMITNHIYMPTVNNKEKPGQEACRLNGWYPRNEDHHDIPVLNLFASEDTINILDSYTKEMYINFDEYSQNPGESMTELTLPTSDNTPATSKTKVPKSMFHSNKTNTNHYNKLSMHRHENENYIENNNIINNTNIISSETNMKNKIIFVMKKHNKWMSVHEIYNSENKEFWKLDTYTPINTVGSRIYEMYTVGIISRDDSGNVYTYKLKNN
jgi:hypothetical protein